VRTGSATGLYHEVNVFGTRTGRTVRAERGERLPGAPLGFGWRLTEKAPDDDSSPD
jgi:hypothetical protein